MLPYPENHRVHTLYAPAKINLGLHVLRRRPDGFHDVDTVMLRVGWSDRLSARYGEEGDGVSLTCSDPSLPTDGRNLVVQAAEALRTWAAPRLYDYQRPRGVRFHLDKRVPHGAGLGGGSSDAAATLRLLRLMDSGGDATDADLHVIAAELGSDVPFFLEAEAQRATGRGETLEPLRHADGAAYRLPFSLVVVMPAVSVPTAGAYGLVTPHDADRPDLAEAVLSNDLERWRRELVNDFQAPIAARHPEIRQVLSLMEGRGAGYAAMTGSGAAVFGVFDRPADARAAYEEAVSLALPAYWQ
jgi:4-diphosphocytidyl-2-C-methyl-D-erythritol kinase